MRDSHEGTKTQRKKGRRAGGRKTRNACEDFGRLRLSASRYARTGLLESVYEACLARALVERGLSVERRRAVPVRYLGLVLDEGFRLDLLVEDRLVIEVKSTERFAPVHGKQVLTYLRLMDLPLGLLMNFGAYTFRDGCRRIADDHYGTVR